MHKPVLLTEVLEHLKPKDGEVYVDATFGAGGYTTAILESANCKVYAIDRDENAIEIAKKLKEKLRLQEATEALEEKETNKEKAKPKTKKVKLQIEPNDVEVVEEVGQEEITINVVKNKTRKTNK